MKCFAAFNSADVFFLVKTYDYFTKLCTLYFLVVKHLLSFVACGKWNVCIHPKQTSSVVAYIMITMNCYYCCILGRHHALVCYQLISR